MCGHQGRLGRTEASPDSALAFQEYERWHVHEKVKYKTTELRTGATTIPEEKGCLPPGFP